MIEYGITTSKADYWVHLCPNDKAAYVYRVETMREYLSINKIPQTIGRSKDGTASGSGFLIPKGTYFIRRFEVDQRYLENFKWQSMTDREKGRAGQFIISILIDQGIIKFPIFAIRDLKTRSEQFSGRDFNLLYFEKIAVEAKADTYESGNLFVQMHEGGHKPNLIHDGGLVVERTSQLMRDESESPL